MVFEKRIGKRRVVLYVALVLTLVLVLTQGVFAFSASAGNSTARGNLGSVNYQSTSGTTSLRGSAVDISGQFSTAGISGRFGLNNVTGTFSENGGGIQNMTLTIISPIADAGLTDTNSSFRFTTTGSVTNCSLFIDGSRVALATSISNSSVNTLLASNIAVGTHVWNITCENPLSMISSQSRTLRIIRVSSFDNQSTDLSVVNLSSVPNLTLSKSFGRVIFSGTTDLTTVDDLDSYVKISSRSIFVDSAALPILNKSATLIIQDIPYSNVVILRNGQVCTSCTVDSYSGGILSFNVTGFSNYTIASTSTLSMCEDTESGQYFPADPGQFYANFSNTTSGQEIAANCSIQFYVNSSWTASSLMSYSPSTKLHNFSRTFGSVGTWIYNITCNTTVSGFDNLLASDLFYILSTDNYNLANINVTLGNSSRFNQLSDGISTISQSGNLSEFLIDGTGVSSGWQGYYGSVSGNIMLIDSQNITFYDWTIVSTKGEVYAARSPAIDWTKMRCANTTQLDTESTLLGFDANDPERHNNTFRTNLTFPVFYSGVKQINSSMNCYTVYLYNSSAQESSTFSQVLLTDNQQIIYTALLTNGVGFNNQSVDFQLMVAEDGHHDDAAITNYYFYVELS